MIDTQVPQSAGWWLHRLLTRIIEKRARLDLLDRYMSGEADPPASVPEARHLRYREFLRRAGMNLGGEIVDAVADRLEPVGFRAGRAGDSAIDGAAWQIWQANGLDGAAKEFHRSVLGMSEGYSIIGPADPSTGCPTITFEDARDMATEPHPIRRSESLAALKLFHDPAIDRVVALLYLPGWVWRAESRLTDKGLWSWDLSAGAFTWVSAARLPISRVPVVMYRNRPRLRGGQVGEFEDAIPHIDRVNEMVFQRIVSVAVQAFKQRALKGARLVDPAGNVINYADALQSGPDALWVLPPGVDVWESGQIDLSGILSSESRDIQTLAAVTGTPPYMLTGDVAGTGDGSASLQREALTFKCKDRCVTLGESHELTMSLAFEWLNGGRMHGLQMLWAPVSSMSIAEQYDAAAKATASGVPWRDVMATVLQFTPEQIARMEKEPQVQRLLAAAAEVPV